MKLHFAESDDPIGNPAKINAACGLEIDHPFTVFAQPVEGFALLACGKCIVKITGKRYTAGIINGEEAKHLGL